MRQKVVIYTRYSSDLQSTRSCVDQEREIRGGLAQKGVDHSEAVVIYDEAESGTKTFRNEFVRLQQMVQAGEVSILAVDDQSRLTRADNAFAFITDLVFADGRFISTSEGLDTDQPGWELRVKVMELHNSATINELGRRVRRGQLGRVLGNLSTGDLPYGYESFFIDPEAAANPRRGPKPEKGIRINDVEARCVRQMFAWFNEGRSISRIARELTKEKAPKGRRRRNTRWRASHVRVILANTKYDGIWHWGKTRTIRNSSGKKKQIPVEPDQQIITRREDLRLVPHDVFETAQRRLAALNEQYGLKPGQKPRGPKVHHTEVYPASLPGGLVYCGECGARMWQTKSNSYAYLMCPRHGSAEQDCSMKTRVPVERAEEAVISLIGRLLSEWPEWFSHVVALMRQRIEEASSEIPERITQDRRQLNDLEQQIEHLVDQLASGVKSQATSSRLGRFESEAEELRRRINEAEQMLAIPAEMPDDEWITQQLSDLTSLLRDDERAAATLLRQIIDRIEAFAVIAPGKVRGFAQLRFRINGWESLRAVIAERLSGETFDMLLSGSDRSTGESDEFVIDLGSQSRMAEWAPKIAEMREHGVSWKEIQKTTGIDIGNAHAAWKRYVDAQQEAEAESAELNAENSDSSSGESDNASDEAA